MIRYLGLYIIIVFVISFRCVKSIKTTPNIVSMKPSEKCSNSHILNSDQLNFCRQSPEIAEAILSGFQIAVKECSYQMSDNKWNCTTAKGSLKKMLKYDTAETGFVTALMTSAAVESLTYACTLGKIMDCSCDKKPISASNNEKWIWSGCNDNIDFAIKKVKHYLAETSNKNANDVRSRVRMHNEKCGGLIVKRNVELKCKCHGMSGSCTLKSCWSSMPPYKKVGSLLKNKYESAIQVKGFNDGTNIVSISKNRLKKLDIVYLINSPQFCAENKKYGILGPSGRKCNINSNRGDSCDTLCCGRSHNVISRMVEKNCQCAFSYCCRIICQKCFERVTEYVCK